MSEALLDRYEDISRRLGSLAPEISAELAGDAFSEVWEPKAQSQLLAWTFREKTAKLSLCALRIQVNAALILQGDRQFLDDLKEDFDTCVDAVRWLAQIDEESGELMDGTAALIGLGDAEDSAQLALVLAACLGISQRGKPPLDRRIYGVGLDMLRYYLHHDLPEAFLTAAGDLTALSEERNRRRPAYHRQIVCQCLALLVDVDSWATLRICQAQAPHFTNVEDSDAAQFYWFYAYASQAVGEYETALPLFVHCNTLCARVDGEDSWLGTMALQMYHRILLGRNKDGSSEAFLWAFIRKAEAGAYPAAREEQELQAACARYIILNFHMEQQAMADDLPELLKLLDFCTAHEAEVRLPGLTVRSATNMLSAHYLLAGDYLQAEQKMLEALHTDPPEGVERMPSDDLILSNLLQIYDFLNDTEQMEKLADLLAERLDDPTLPDYERDRYFVLVQSTYALLGYDMEVPAGTYQQALADAYEALLEGNTEELTAGGVTGAWSVVAMISTVIDSGIDDGKTLGCCQGILQFLLDSPHIFPFNNVQWMLLHQEMARVLCVLGDKAALHHMQKSMHYGREMGDFDRVKITNLRIAALIFYQMGDPASAEAIAEASLKNITDAWHNVTSYINDHRLCQVLAAAQENYNVFYAVLSARKPPAYLYDQLLRYKDLPSLVGRERNRYLNSASIDKALRDRIYELQDKLADAQMSDALCGADSAGEIARKLQRAEAAFAEKFPRDIQYTEVSIAGVGQKLKENEALIEYYFAPGAHALGGGHAEWGETALDIFVLTKKAGQVRLSYTRLPDGVRIYEDAAAFTDTMQNPNTSDFIGEKETLRESLYHTLLGFALNQLEHVSTLYIAPDMNLCNLPFEILYAAGHAPLQERFRVCRLVCGRDLVFFAEGENCGHGAFVLGDPDFEAERGEESKDRRRQAVGTLAPVGELPFSGIEARRIARRCGTVPFVGRAATKYALQETIPCRIIHLATHGHFDEEMESDSLYSSCLVFAGFNRWIREKTPGKGCGNGILTADEISRMDLRDTELVVLSACNSGMGDYSARSVRGLLSAFSAAGVRWVVSHIWAADDFTTPILMDAFYDAYLTRGMDVPEALQYAKNYLRNVTVGELRRDGWLDLGMEARLPEPAKAYLKILQEANDRRKPFMDESNWGGFVCYQCK